MVAGTVIKTTSCVTRQCDCVRGGEDEEERQAARLDDWIVWEAEERIAA